MSADGMLPFSAVVGQDDAKLALLLAAMHPRLGGVLLRGDKGSAKTTLARGLAHLLPGDAPFVELPLGATEDRVLGSIDLAELLSSGSARYRPGLLAAAHGGVLYVDEINLLADHLVDALLDVAVSGVNRVEREGVSHTHPARFVLVASMNPEEGELRPQLLDRFGLAVDVRAADDVDTRSRAVVKQLAMEHDPAAINVDRRADRELAARLATATPAAIPEDVIDTACRVALAVGAEGLRADLMMCRAAAAHAGWCGRDLTTEEDVRRVAPFVLAHRRRRTPFDEPGISDDELHQAFSDAASDGDHARDTDHEEVGEPDGRVQSPLNDSARAPSGPSGRANVAISARGRYVRHIAATESAESIAPVPTVVAAATRRAAGGPESDARVARDDLREAVREERTGRLIVLAVDTSGSMGVERRIAAAKSATLALLADAYKQRNRVAVVAFRGECAEIVMRPTASIEIARTRLAGLPCGGTTPLAHALDVALAVALKGRDDHLEPQLMIITDGRATSGGSDPLVAAEHAAARVARARIDAIVVDAEAGVPKLGLAEQLARCMRARYVRLTDFVAATDDRPS